MFTWIKITFIAFFMHRNNPILTKLPGSEKCRVDVTEQITANSIDLINKQN